MKRMLFNATQAEELRVAIVDGQKLIDLDIESASKEERKSNIYKAVITRIEPSLEAAFVDYGAERHGFLPFKEISRSYFQPGVDAGKASIKEALKEGQELIVQVEKDERGNKGAALTTYISLAGRYLVLMPNNPRGGGVSRRVEGDERAELREAMDQLDVPQGMSLIARTAAIGRSAEELSWDLSYLLQLWRAIEGAAQGQSGAFLIYQEGSLVIRAIRDYFQPDIGEILIDTDDVYEQACQFMGHVMPANVARVKRYSDDVPLFSRFQIEHQIESAYSRQVGLPSGGAVVIDHTEALVSIDVNSGRATKGSDIEETAFRTNCEAADEIARQLRLRDLGGLIVIDFIDMESAKNQREVENRLRDALRHDRARVQTGKISRFGLLELSRQRLRPALAETSYITCPRCNGTGHIRSTESSALHIVRILEEEAMKENTGAVHLQVPVDVATFLLNEKRVDIARIEMRHKVQLIIVPNRHLETPAHEIIRLRHDQLNAEDIALASYQMVQKPAEDVARLPSTHNERPARQEAAVKGIAPAQPAPVATSAAQAPAEVSAAPAPKGLLERIMGWFTGSKPQAAPAPEPVVEAAPKRESRTRGERNGEGRRNGGSRGRRGERDGDAQSSRGVRSERQERTEATDKPQRADKAERSSERTEGRGRGRNRGERSNERAAETLAATGAPAAGSPAPGTPAAESNDELLKSAAALTAVAATTAAEAAPADAASGEEGASGEKRRRRGRGRGRRSGEALADAAAQDSAAGEDAATAEDAGSVPAAPVDESPAAEALPAATEIATEVSEQPAPTEPAQAEAQQAQVEQPVEPVATEATPAEAPAVAEVDAVEPAAAPAAEAAQTAEEAAALPVVASEVGADHTAPVDTAATDTAATDTAATDTAAVDTAVTEAEALAPVELASEAEQPAAVEAPAAEAAEAQAVVEEAATQPIVEEGTAVEAEAPAAADTAPSLIERAAIAARTTNGEATADETTAPLAPSAPISVPSESGLVMIETDPTKRATFGTGAPEQPVRLGRKPRPAPVIVEEALQQVETRN
ncbi:Rne/Rng family ribonuclease [Thauera sp. Sel9]|uniref:Rne/Rng family ribonuclease n=1 Tax=Thauera sp. Sel9 TaxID=2974299 RepID=UPI0021E116CC|nr:Rne/Rng family ribonuclease [Thauera sp. Sel9]MCV2216610.1 Rne/Rng family ribonuclease [Thauera sp. Sel9]